MIMFDRLHFCCLLNAIQNKLYVHLDSDIIYMIYYAYVFPTYSEYSIFELISMLDARNIYMDCTLNKQAILQFMKHKQIEIPMCLQAKPIDWCVYDNNAMNIYNTIRGNVCINTTKPCYTVYIKHLDTKIEIQKEDVYVINDSPYTIEDITENTIQFDMNDRSYLINITDFIRYFNDSYTTIQINSSRKTFL